jgi:hypothetical protein
MGMKIELIGYCADGKHSLRPMGMGMGTDFALNFTVRVRKKNLI